MLGAARADKAGMDFFDVFALLPFGLPGPRGGDRSPGELLAGVIAYFVLPLLAFVLVLFAGLWAYPVIAMVALPIAFAGVSVLVCALVDLPTPTTLVTGLACALSTFIVSGIAFLLGVVGSFFSGF
jgi:hypothetical protein